MRPLIPAMAAALLAALPSFATPPSRPVTAPAACGDARQDVVLQMSCLIQGQEQAKKDSGERIADFFVGGDGRYLRDELKAENAQADRRALGEAAKRWASENPGGSAPLYLVLGPAGERPAWAASPLLQAYFTKSRELERLRGTLERAGFTRDNRVPRTESPAKLHELLSAASAEALKIIRDDRELPEIIKRINENDVTRENPPVSPEHARATQRTWTGHMPQSEMYQNGALVVDVCGPDDAGCGNNPPDGYRTLSVKIYTVRENGATRNVIGVIDITDPEDLSSTKFIELNHRGDAKFQLRQGGRSYKINISQIGREAQYAVRVSRTRAHFESEAEEKAHDAQQPRQSIRATLGTSKDEDLGEAAADQIRRAAVKNIDGKNYLVVPQGGPTAAFKFYDPASLADGTPLYKVQPAGMCVVREVRGGGTVDSDGLRGMGRGPLADYSCKKVNGRWDVVKEKAPDAGTPDSVPKESKDAPASGPAATGPGATGPGASGALAGLIEAAKKAGYSGDGELNTHLDAATRAKVYIMKSQDGQHKVLFDPSFAVENNQMGLKAKNDSGSPITIYSVPGSLVAVQIGEQRDYFTPEQLAGFAKGGLKNDAPKTGRYNLQKQLEGVSSVELFKHVATAVMGWKAGDVDEIVKRVNAAANGRKFSIGTRAPNSVEVLVDEKDIYRVWPGNPQKVEANPTVSDFDPECKDLKGQGTCYKKTEPQRSDARTFDATWPIEGGRTAQRVKAAPGIALYEAKDEEKLRRNGTVVETRQVTYYFVLFDHKRLEGSGPAAVDVRSGRIMVFGEGRNQMEFPGLDKITLKGVAGARVRAEGGVLGLYQGSTKEKGAWALYQVAPTDAQGLNIQDKAKNCVGPLIWWGMTEDQARKGCPDAKVQ